MCGMAVRLWWILHEAMALDQVTAYLLATGVPVWPQSAYLAQAVASNGTVTSSADGSHSYLQTALFGLLVQPLLPHLIFNAPRFWPSLLPSFLLSLLTGTIISIGIIYPLVMLFGIATIDSLAWSTRGVDTAAANRGMAEVRMRKTKKYVALGLFMGMSFFVSYMSFFHGTAFTYYYYWPVQPEACVSLCAARTLNAVGELTPRHHYAKRT